MGLLLVIITIWAAVFYYAMLDEIYDSIDDGLDNQKNLVIQKAKVDTSVLSKNEFVESGYAILEIPATRAIQVHDVYADTVMYMQNEQSNEPVRMLTSVFLHNKRYYQLQIATSMVEEDDLVRELFYSVLWLYIGLVITLLLFNSFLIRRIWKPFYKLLKQLKNFSLDKPIPPVLTSTKVDEFKLLYETTSKMLRQNIATYRNQKQFIENASHELQTPLAVAITKLETLAEQASFDNSSGKLLTDALDQLERLTRLNRSLLLLSKIDNQQFHDEKEVNLNEILRKVVADFEQFALHGEILIALQETAVKKLIMNEDLAQILATNLIKNAIVHNQPGGYVNVVIEESALTIINTGKDAEADPEKIFQRFQSTKMNSSSTGLGLAIAQSICKLYRLRITYYFKETHHFVVHFPA
jgi:signal transduction histidine kinase